MTTEPRTTPAADAPVKPRPQGQRARETREEAEARRAETLAEINVHVTTDANRPAEVAHDDLRDPDDFEKVMRQGRGISWCRAMPDHREPEAERWFIVNPDGSRRPADARGIAVNELALRAERLMRGWAPPELPK